MMDGKEQLLIKEIDAFHTFNLAFNYHIDEISKRTNRFSI